MAAAARASFRMSALSFFRATEPLESRHFNATRSSCAR